MSDHDPSVGSGFGDSLRRRNRWGRRHRVGHRLGNREDPRIALFTGVGLVVVVSVRCLVPMIAGVLRIIMMVVANVKMEVEETGAHFAVAVPVIGCVQTEAGRTQKTCKQQAWPRVCQPADQDSAKSSHLWAPS